MPERTVDSADAGSTLLAYLADFDAGTCQRGSQYHRSGRVGHVIRSDDTTVSGEVLGSKPYLTRLRRINGAWSSSCSCPLGDRCKHVVALALSWLRGARPTTTLPERNLTFRQQWEPVLAGKIGRPLDAHEGAFLGKLAQIFHNLQQSGRVFASDLQRLGFATAEASRGFNHVVFDGWWTTPPKDPMELWQYIAHDIESSGLSLPEFLRPVTHTAEIRARVHNRQRRESIQRWQERFEHLQREAESAAENTAPPERFDLRLCVGSDKWILETRAAADQPWKPAPRLLLDRFTRDRVSLASIEASPEVFAFLALCQNLWAYGFVRPLAPEYPDSRQLLHRALMHPMARRVVTGPGGMPLQFEREPLRWHVTRSSDADDEFVIALHRADGTPLPPSALFLPGQPPLYLHGHTVYRGPPALDGSSAAGAVVPAEVIESAPILQTLHEFGAQLPREFEERFVTIPLRARIECATAVDFGGVELFELRLLAVSDQPPIVQAWKPEGWQDEDEPETPAEKIVIYERAAAAAVVPHLNAFGLVFNPQTQRWTRRFTRKFPDEFVAWRERLPADVEVFATGELASLLSAPVRATVDFSLLESPSHRDWFDLALALKPEDTTLTPDEIRLLLKARGKLVRLPGKGWRRLDVTIADDSAAALESAGFDRNAIAEAALAGERHRFHALQLAQSAVADLLPQRQAETLRARAREISRPAAPAIPAGLRAELRPYQKDGFEFLVFLSSNRLGGVLADDMGLGKTVQTLAWLLWLAEGNVAAGRGLPTPPPRRSDDGAKSRRGQEAPPYIQLRALVVCPKSVVGNWEAEVAKFAPAIETIRFRPKLDATDFESVSRPALVIANYTQLRLNAEFFTAQKWHAVILDEGQFIKNPASKVAQIARDLPGDHRVVLTGTPIENRLLDLWSLFAFALPGLLGAQASFKRHFAEDNPLALSRLRARVRHFLLRRTKAQVAADLPPRTEEDVFVELEGDQRKLYEAELKRARAELLKVKTAREFDQARFNILASLLRLRQICCHPALIDRTQREAPSAKLDELLARVEELRDEGHQVLVFSQFVEMLELIREKFAAAGIEHLLLTGQTENREALVAEFQAEKRRTVFLLSLKAAGFGLNLTAASYVIVYDPWWNPAVEAQAIDRTHRIGQANPVIAYRLIARGTVEEKIRALQKEKSALAGAIVQEESLASMLDLESLREILS